MTLGDIYYVIFRHKWKISIISALGLLAAGVLPFVTPRLYQSEAKIFIRYVLENKSPGGMAGGATSITSPNEGGGGIINSEIEILTSLDLAQQVAESIGPEKVLAKAGGGKDRNGAAGLIQANLVVLPAKSSVITIRFQHPDPAMVQPVLNELVEAYFKRHAEVHRAVGVFDDFLTQETDQLRSRLVQTENALRAAKTNAGVISLEDAKKSYSEQLSKIRLEIFAAEAEMAERQASVGEMEKLFSTQPLTTTNAVAQSNFTVVPPAKIKEYRRLAGLLDMLTRREMDLSVWATASNNLVKSVQEQISGIEKLKVQLEIEHPGLLGVATSEAGPRARDPQMDLAMERSRLAAIAYKIRVLTNQLAQVRREAGAVEVVEGSITELQRKKELEEASYKNFSISLEQARIDAALGAGRVANISKIQAPTPPRPASKLNKMMAMVALGSIAAAVALAFLIEMFVDRSVRRPSEIQTHLNLPLFLSIPRMSLKGKPRGLQGRRKVALLNSASSSDGDATGAHSRSAEAGGDQGSENAGVTAELVFPTASIAPWDVRHTLRPFFETLRDRLIVFFEAINLTHKPKLVAVTSCGAGAGVTTTAAGLAACLSETGDGNVLLVDMNRHRGEAHHFFKGHLACGLDELLEGGKRDEALVQKHLYVATEGSNDSQLPQFLPKRFNHLIPKLRASDYDYIIFDMPPVTQISPTPRLARFMDMVFLVVESEKTDRDVVKRATTLLSESISNVGVILNKSKAYVPKRLQAEF